MKVVLASALAALCIALTGCADPTGEIDDKGHNGYDEMTCQDAKAFALDVQNNTVLEANREARIQQISKEGAKAGDDAIRSASKALITGYAQGNRKAVNDAVKSLVKACQL